MFSIHILGRTISVGDDLTLAAAVNSGLDKEGIAEVTISSENGDYVSGVARQISRNIEPIVKKPHQIVHKDVCIGDVSSESVIIYTAGN